MKLGKIDIRCADCGHPMRDHACPGPAPVSGSVQDAEDNYERQEALVSALYRFHESQQDHEHTCKYRSFLPEDAPERSIYLPGVDAALTEILKIFGQPRIFAD